MHISSAKTSDTSRTLTVTVSDDELKPIKARVVRELSRTLKVAGFRTGKVPEAVAEKNLDPSVLQAEFLESAVSASYSQAIAHEKLRAVGAPQVSIKKFVPYDTLEFEAVVDVIGTIKLADYHKFKKPLPEVSVADDEVEAVVSSLRRRQAAKVPVERAAAEGDEVIIDFDGADAKGSAINGAASKAYPLILGSNTFIPGFEPNIIGLKAGDTKTFTIPFPKDYQVTSLAGKKVTFTVTVTAVNQLDEPALDDVFAASAGPFTSLDALRADIKKELAYEAATRARRQFENELMAEIASGSTVQIPKSLVDEQIQQLEAEERRNVAYRGQTWDEHLKEEGVSSEEHAERQRPRATEIITGSLLLTEIASQEGITVSDEEVDMRLTLLKGQYSDKAMRAELDKPESRRETEGRMMAEKTLERLVEIVSSAMPKK